MADGRIDLVGGGKCDWVAIRSRDVVSAGLEVHRTLCAVSSGGIGIHGGKKVPAI